MHVTLNADHQYFYLKVEDSGIGIPEDSLEHIYERFYRVDKARSRAAGGAGLGLSIVHDMVERSYGTITVQARPGGGTRAQVLFPLASCEDIPPEMELHSDEENDIRAARFASRAAQEILLLRRY